MGGSMREWGGWMDGWMGGWVGGQMDCVVCSYIEARFLACRDRTEIPLQGAESFSSWA